MKLIYEKSSVGKYKAQMSSIQISETENIEKYQENIQLNYGGI